MLDNRRVSIDFVLVINFIYNAKKTNSYLILTVEVDSPSTQWAAVTTQ